MKKIQIGDTVTVNYTGKLEDGTVFDSSLIEGRTPLVAKLGEGKLIRGFESGLVDMVEGEKKTVEIESSDAYGDYNEALIVEVPKSQIGQEVQVGQPLRGEGPNGSFTVIVVEILQDTVKVDANHPLAGKKLIFDLEVVGVS